MIYDILGNRKTMTDITGTTNYTYDFLSRLTGEEKDGKLKTYTYNKYGGRTNLKLTEGDTERYALTYTYDNLSRNKQLSGMSLAASFTYTKTGKVAKNKAH